MPLSALTLGPANARAHSARNLDTFKGSLARFGQVEPLFVLKGAGRVIGGNDRLVAVRALGWSECDIVEVASQRSSRRMLASRSTARRSGPSGTTMRSSSCSRRCAKKTRSTA
ncbi:MAG: ParB N-terminal domain-containing protein [Planctomycetes bacterium]|nr:ParB N-terminal domain-containing protein [Planctomycetota bacterium]